MTGFNLKRKQDTIELRKYPFPYRSAFTICSDIDECSIDTFLTLHKFLNTCEQTEIGEGLGLDIGDTFWLFSANTHDVALFDGLTSKLSPSASIVVDFIRAGYLDCLHSYGDFVPNDFSRKTMRKAIKRGLDFLEEENLHVDTWINHGGPAEKVNLWARNHLSYEGDNPNSNLYHFDLLKSYGIQFVWSDELTDHLLHEVDFGYAPISISWLKSVTTFKNIVKHLTRNKGKVRSIKTLNNILEHKQLRDNNSILLFKRFHRGTKNMWDGPNREGLARQLTETVLNQLIKREATSIVYTHMGMTERPHKADLFDPETIEGLRRLSLEHRKGNIFVTTTSRLLNFIVRRDGLIWHTNTLENGIIDIHLESIKDVGYGTKSIKPSDLEGLCFRTLTPDHVRIWLGNSLLNADIDREYDGTGYCTGFSFSKLKFPEAYI